MRQLACQALVQRRADVASLAASFPQLGGALAAQIAEIDRQLAAFGCTAPVTTTTTTSTSTTTTRPTATTIPGIPPAVQQLACQALLQRRADVARLAASFPQLGGALAAQIAEIDRQLAAFGCTPRP